MVTVRQLLELMHEDDLVAINNDETGEDEFFGNVKGYNEHIPNTILDSNVANLFSRTDSVIAIYREVRK